MKYFFFTLILFQIFVTLVKVNILVSKNVWVCVQWLQHMIQEHQGIIIFFQNSE